MLSNSLNDRHFVNLGGRLDKGFFLQIYLKKLKSYLILGFVNTKI